MQLVILHIVTCEGFTWLIIMGSGFGWLYLLALLLQLQSIITAHNWCLSQTRSFPCWTTSVFSSTVTNDERRTPSHWIIELPYECRMIELSSTELASRGPKYRSPARTVRVILFSRCHETCLSNRWLAMDYSLSIRCSGNVCLASRWLATDFRSDSTIPAFRHHVTLCWKNPYDTPFKLIKLLTLWSCTKLDFP
jgi:hypothetical protein